MWRERERDRENSRNYQLNYFHLTICICESFSMFCRALDTCFRFNFPDGNSRTRMREVMANEIQILARVSLFRNNRVRERESARETWYEGRSG